ncbi:transport protein sec23 [Cucumis melo var. makuwa]|uniref:Transport protein sec23 n=1 Tax=Cucumis melo var. makuwa TaxID=1194695 RepID=A0A5A7TBX5_CUCMM|nr:transport protein sec23 [Cucumis melo var. makuwa]TYK15279.1 transport protein sec23 [Cucumis melo var. makuwa]
MEKLLQRIQTPPIYPMGQPSTSSVQPSGQKQPHAPPSVNLIAHPIRFYTPSPIQPSHPSSHLPPHVPPITARQQPAKLSNLLGIEAGKSSAPFGYGQPYICGLKVNQTYRRAVFEVGASLAQSKSTDQPMYSKNPVISLPNVPLNYITNSATFSAQSLTHDNEKNNGKPILVCEHCKKQWHTKDQCWKLHSCPPRGNNRSFNEQQNLGHIDVRETTSTSQPTGPTASQTGSPTLSVIAQSAMFQFLGLISVDGKNP